MDIRSAQELAWENRPAEGFNPTDIPLEFCLLGLAEMTGADVQDAVVAKLDNHAQAYHWLPDGVMVKTAAGPPAG